MNKKIRDAIFFLIVFTLIFNNIPKPVQLNFIGGPVGGKLVVYPLLAGFIYSFWCQYKGHKVWTDWKPFSRYAAVYIGVMLLSVVIGLIQYPYYDLVLNGPVGQIEKLPWVLDKLHSHGIDVDSKLLMQAWVIVRQIKSVFMETFWLFGGAYMIYCWYKTDVQVGIRILLKGLTASVVVLIIYGIIETFYLAGYTWAAETLSAINPYLHKILTNHGWWPPLLWKNQMRLVFTEPSNVGNYIAFAVPMILGICIFCKKTLYRNLSFITMVLMSFMIFLTKARTCYGMMVGMLALLLVLLLIRKERSALKRYGIVLLCVFAGFIGFIQFSAINVYAVDGNVKNEAKVQESVALAKDAMDNNLGSLASSNKRSNKARYTLLKSYFYVGLEHPLLGVGSGLKNAYVEKYLSAEAGNNKEIQNWVNRHQQYGPLAEGQSIPDSMNEYINRFSSSGILGFIVAYFPFVFILARLFKKVRDRDGNGLIMMFALCSSLVAGCNGSLTMIYCVWVLLGLSYALCFGKSSEDDEQKDVNESA